ncbi:SH3 domain-containing protein [Chloroflexi bacterium TSY]|nr:SH3 domain-containing protein [Chloroflexi bacterium TSY]
MLILTALSLSGCLIPVQAEPSVDITILEIYELPQIEQVNITEAIIRKSADATSVEIGRLPLNASVVVVARRGDWKKVEVLQDTSSEGWILANFLTQMAIVRAVVNASTLNVRTGPGTIFDRIGSVKQADVAYVIGQAYQCAWLRVITPDRTEGWISAEYAHFDSSCDTIPEGRIPVMPATENVTSVSATPPAIAVATETPIPTTTPTLSMFSAPDSSPSSRSTPSPTPTIFATETPIPTATPTIGIFLTADNTTTPTATAVATETPISTSTPSPTPTLLEIPTPDFIELDLIGYIGNMTCFTVTIGDDLEATFFWDFGTGDDEEPGEKRACHTYDSPGKYVVKVTAKTECCESSNFMIVRILSTENPSLTPTDTPTVTPTTINVPTVIPTITPTVTNIPTVTPTDMPSVTNTPTVTPIPTATDTPTATPTPTATNTPTVTPTPVIHPEVRVHHGKQGYTEEEVKQSFELDYIPPFVFGEGTQIMYVQLAEMERYVDNGVELKGGHLIAGIPFHVNDDGSVDQIIFHVPGGSIIILQVGDQEGRHFDTSRYMPAPYVADNGHTVVHAYRTPSGIWHFELVGAFDMSRSRDVIFMAEVASQHLAREIGGTVMENSVGRALAREGRFGLWQRPDVEVPDGPWASQYMAAQCGQIMYYNANVTPHFVNVTGTVSFENLRDEDMFWRSLRSFPSPPNLDAKYKAWYCANVKNNWQSPAVYRHGESP